jgi:hypothetical protein
VGRVLEAGSDKEVSDRAKVVRAVRSRCVYVARCCMAVQLRLLKLCTDRSDVAFERIKQHHERATTLVVRHHQRATAGGQ